MTPSRNADTILMLTMNLILWVFSHKPWSSKAVCIWRPALVSIIYIKSLGDKALYRVEESVKMRCSLVDVLRTIRSPSELWKKN